MTPNYNNITHCPQHFCNFS